MVKYWFIFTLLVLAVSACRSTVPAVPTDLLPPQPEGNTSSETTVFLPPETPPIGAGREFNTDFSKHTVPYSEILSGGPEKDGIPAIDDPSYVTVAEADDWL